MIFPALKRSVFDGPQYSILQCNYLEGPGQMYTLAELGS